MADIVHTISALYWSEMSSVCSVWGNLEVDILLGAAAELQYGSTYKGLVD